MPDQPIPDFSQNQQYAPGFQQQMPIPGISSSYGNQQFQSQFQQQPFNNSQFTSQQADMLAMQSMNNSHTTMAIAQQNLMYSMRNAMQGGMMAFSDVSRRAGTMITNMSPVGKYNDLLAPNQNWALESSFRREIGFKMMQGAGVDPYNSTFSRIIQGRRPEFLNEGEYSATMGYASQIRVANMTKAMAGIVPSSLLGLGLSAAGAGLATTMIAPMAIGFGIERLVHAQQAEHEDLLEGQMFVRNKRMGIGQQFMSTANFEGAHKTFYGKSNPYISRLLGDTLGSPWKPDMDKNKLMKDMMNDGMFAFEKLDANSIENYVNSVSASIEKFSRIAKSTREASRKIMAHIKQSGIHGDQMLNTFQDFAYQSNLTGIDVQDYSGAVLGYVNAGKGYGFDNNAMRQSASNVLSGFAMMQSHGAFKGQDLMDMTNNIMTHNMQNSRDIFSRVMKYGTPAAYMRSLGKDKIRGFILDQTNMDEDPGGFEPIQRIMDNPLLKGNAKIAAVKDKYGDDPRAMSYALNYESGIFSKQSEKNEFEKIRARYQRSGKEIPGLVSPRDWAKIQNPEQVELSLVFNHDDYGAYDRTKELQIQHNLKQGGFAKVCFKGFVSGLNFLI